MIEGGSGGVGLLTVIGVVFVILKLVGTITWPWAVVLIPFYPALLILPFALVVIIIAAIRS